MTEIVQGAPGIQGLLHAVPQVLAGRPMGLVAHAASVLSDGRHTVAACLAHPELMVRSLFAPEHGFAATAGAGDRVDDSRHPVYDLPVRSLYGATRKPTPAMLEELEVLVVDLQDLAVRCYTYASTLDLVLEAAAEYGLPVVVCDRPLPVPGLEDGPDLDPKCASFVGRVPTRYCFGLTQGELARRLQATRYPNLDLTVMPMTGVADTVAAHRRVVPWVPPSPGIRSWETAVAYPATVFCEALPAFDVDRSGLWPFQVWTAPFLHARNYAAALNAIGLTGVTFEPWAGNGEGVRLCVHDPAAFRPATCAVHLIAVAQQQAGKQVVWGGQEVREGFFDQLWGTSSVREGLQAGLPPAEIVMSWRGE